MKNSNCIFLLGHAELFETVPSFPAIPHSSLGLNMLLCSYCHEKFPFSDPTFIST